MHAITRALVTCVECATHSSECSRDFFFSVQMGFEWEASAAIFADDLSSFAKLDVVRARNMRAWSGPSLFEGKHGRGLADGLS